MSTKSESKPFSNEGNVTAFFIAFTMIIFLAVIVIFPVKAPKPESPNIMWVRPISDRYIQTHNGQDGRMITNIVVFGFGDDGHMYWKTGDELK